jgi:hypothetical protein
MIITVLLWAAFAWCSLAALAGLAAMRANRGWGDPGDWDGPLLLASFSLALAAVLGLLPPLPGAVTATVPLLVIAAMLAPHWDSAVKLEGSHGRAARRILADLGRRALALMLSVPRFLRDLPAALQPAAPPAGDPQPATPAPAGPRRTPSTARPNPDLGPVPVPSQVAADLNAAGVAVPAAWAAVAERFAAFEPEDGEDLRLFIAENAAGILVVAEAIGGQAEDLSAGIKLDPAFTEAQVAFADDFADTASAAAMTLRAYDNAYALIDEHVDNGGTLVENARQWHGADGPEGQAA